MSYDTDKATRKQKKRARKAAQARLDDMDSVLRTEAGKRVILEILEIGGPMSRIPAMDEGLTQRCLGRRELALDIQEWAIEANPSAFIQLFSNRIENMQNQNENLTEREDDDGSDD